MSMTWCSLFSPSLHFFSVLLILKPFLTLAVTFGIKFWYPVLPFLKISIVHLYHRRKHLGIFLHAGWIICLFLDPSEIFLIQWDLSSADQSLTIDTVALLVLGGFMSEWFILERDTGCRYLTAWIIVATPVCGCMSLLFVWEWVWKWEVITCYYQM